MGMELTEKLVEQNYAARRLSLLLGGDPGGWNRTRPRSPSIPDGDGSRVTWAYVAWSPTP